MLGTRIVGEKDRPPPRRRGEGDECHIYEYDPEVPRLVEGTASTREERGALREERDLRRAKKSGK